MSQKTGMGGDSLGDSVCLPDKVLREEFSIPSSDGNTALAGYVWTAPGVERPRAVVQLVHGMAEHVLRYDPFARFLASHGFAVVGHDHLGHGKSVETPSSWGVLEPHRGADHLVEDVHRTRAFGQKRFPGAPYFIFGHSMGSFVLRNYLCAYGKGLTGAVVCATGWQPRAALAFGKAVCDVIGGIGGWNRRSGFVHSLADGAYERAFGSDEGGKLGWLSRDPAQREAFSKDPACGFTFSVAAYHELFSLVGSCQSRQRVSYMQPGVPVLLLTGSRDPVGGNGEAIFKVASLMRSCGVRDVQEKIYPEARHELLNETNRDEVFSDVLEWCEACLNLTSRG